MESTHQPAAILEEKDLQELLPTEEITSDFPAGWMHKEKPPVWRELSLRQIPKKDATSQSPGNAAAAPGTPLPRCSEGSGTSRAEQEPAWKLRTNRYCPLCRNKREDLEYTACSKEKRDPTEPTSAWAASICSCRSSTGAVRGWPSRSRSGAKFSGMGGSRLRAHPQARPFPPAAMLLQTAPGICQAQSCHRGPGISAEATFLVSERWVKTAGDVLRDMLSFAVCMSAY